jgi:hypothetical protein
MATKQEVADYINANFSTSWSAEEEAKIDAILTPETAEILIKLVGDVSFLIDVRDNKSN